MVERLPHDALAHRIAGALDIGGLCQKQQHAVSADLRNAAEIGMLAVDRRKIDLVIPRMKDDADRSGDRQRDRARDRVVDVDKFHRKTPQLDDTARLDAVQADVVEVVFLQLVFRQRKRELGAEYRDVEFF